MEVFICKVSRSRLVNNPRRVGIVSQPSCDTAYLDIQNRSTAISSLQSYLRSMAKRTMTATMLLLLLFWVWDFQAIAIGLAGTYVSLRTHQVLTIDRYTCLYTGQLSSQPFYIRVSSSLYCDQERNTLSLTRILGETCWESPNPYFLISPVVKSKDTTAHQKLLVSPCASSYRGSARLHCSYQAIPNNYWRLHSCVQCSISLFKSGHNIRTGTYGHLSHYSQRGTRNGA